jgi:eukaryotic-like serine/threonine-protein kinase
MATEKIGKVKILNNLGSGANSTIFHVRRESDAKEFALKIVPIQEEEDKKYLEQAEHEFKIAQRFNHPNLIKIFSIETETDWFRRPKKVKMLLEYNDGKTLDQVKLLKMTKMLRVFEKVASGLVHMHKNDVIHADLKPGNILMGQRGTVKIIDYGLSWIKGEPKFRIQGTPEYMAPETFQHKMISERTDIYNLGATMYRLVTLKLPPSMQPTYEGLEMTEKEFKEKLVPVKEINRGVPDELADLIHRCLSFNALNRPERMSEIQGTLDRLVEEFAPEEDEE